MKTIKASFVRIVCLAFALTAFAYAAAAEPIRITVKRAPTIDGVAGPISGRLLVFMKKSGAATDSLGPDFTDPNAVWISGIEVNDLSPDKPITFDPDVDRFPFDFAKAPAGDYQLFALLDRDHSYTYYGADGGDVYSSVTKITLPASSAELTLYKTVPERKPVASANARIVEFESPMLSAFWGRPIMMQATVLLPPGYSKGSQKYPTVYSIHGYGGDHVYRGGDALVKSMADGKQPEMIYVFLNAHNSLGHHVFADSVNNGPWGTALVSEFIPHLEKQFRMDARPSGRFLTGHSSGGWSSLWVMVTHPDFFGGTWSTSPDPTDFRNFTGPDLTNVTQNAYSDASGKDYGLVRMNGKDVATVKQYAQQEMVLGDFGGQFGSFNAVFSPKGADGRPMPLFDIETGRIDPFVAKAWEKYDISRMLRDNWKTLGPRLKGKLHIYVGTADTFHLDESLRLLDGELKKLGSDARVEYLPGKTHFDLYKDGLREKIAAEMYAVARPKAKSAAK
ncbi:MAG: alpha/beta hydrolase [Pyrinomonadaceae bacterium]